MKFIRKNGRTIPIREKSDKKNVIIDTIAGAASGFVLAGFHAKRRNLFKVMFGVDMASDLYTISQRWKNRKSLGDFAKKELTGSLFGYGAYGASFYGTHKLLKTLQKVRANKWANLSTKLIR